MCTSLSGIHPLCLCAMRNACALQESPIQSNSTTLHTLVLTASHVCTAILETFKKRILAQQNVQTYFTPKKRINTLKTYYLAALDMACLLIFYMYRHVHYKFPLNSLPIAIIIIHARKWWYFTVINMQWRQWLFLLFFLTSAFYVQSLPSLYPSSCSFPYFLYFYLDQYIFSFIFSMT